MRGRVDVTMRRDERGRLWVNRKDSSEGEGSATSTRVEGMVVSQVNAKLVRAIE